MSQFDFDEIIDRADTDSSKFDAGRVYNPYLPEEYIPMWVADMDFACPQPILDAMHRRLDRRILGYSNYPSTMSEDYYGAIIRWVKRRHGITAARENISFSTGVVDSAREAIASMSGDGDGVMIHTPCYQYLHDPILEFDRKVVKLPLNNDGGCYTIDFDAFEREAAKPENTLLLLCSPHNPSGRVWTEDELRRTAEICFWHGVRIFSDEIHNDLTRKSSNMVSLTALYPGDPRIVTAMSTSKTFNTAGNNHSYVIIYDEKIKAAFDDSRYCGTPNPLSVVALMAAYNECEDWVDALRDYLDENMAWLDRFVKENLPKVKFRIPEGTYLTWLDLSAYGLSEEALYQKISAAGLYLEFAGNFVDNAEGFVRMNAACPKSTLVRACAVLKKALEG